MDPYGRRKAKARTRHGRYSKTHLGVLNDPERIDQEGILGEQAFAGYMGIPQSEIHGAGLSRYNFRLDDGTTVDVRASSARGARLIVGPKDIVKKAIDVFVLAEIVKPNIEGVELRGWIERTELAKVDPRKISHRPEATAVHAMSQSQLRPMEELKERHIPHMKDMFGNDIPTGEDKNRKHWYE